MRDSRKNLEKMRKIVQKICVLLELAAALLVLVAILLSFAGMVRDVTVYQRLLTDTSEFRRYLEHILMIVIGIEFLGMLCRPNSENVIEVLIFLVARHMIVGDTTPYQDFVSVISIALLCVLRRYLRMTGEKQKEKNKENRDGAEDASQQIIENKKNDFE